MPDETPDDPNTFPVDTNFQKMARRAGGIPREQAMENARVAIDAIKVNFRDWLDSEIDALAGQVRRGRSPGVSDLGWAESAAIHCRQIRDVGTTMGFQLVTFVAGNLFEILEGIAAGASPRNEMIDCHIDALYLAKQERYRHFRPDQLPELSDGLRRILEATHAPADDANK